MSLLKSRSTYVKVVLFAVLLFTLVSCSSENPQSIFEAHGPVAESQLNVLWWITWGAILVFIVVGAPLMYITLRFRRKPGQGDPVQTHGNTPLEIAWTIIPILLLAVLAVPNTIAIFDNLNTPDKDAMTVDVIGHQWWFEFKYKDPNGNGSVITANELHIPVGEVVNINLDSKDVIHSFWIPKLAGKVDIVPGNKNKMWIQADKAGEYRGQCAEFCGEAHALMRFRVVAESQTQFDEWLATEGSSAKEPIEPLAIQGKVLFEGNKAQCWSCHTITGSAKSRGQVGPNLTHFASRGHLAAGVIENNQANLKKWIEDPESVKPGTIMFRDAKVYSDPARKLSDSDLSAIVAYLQTLK
tara:strand:- start:2622 stop:3686 length:1065 start_codon:yes stop_codon:yes gene_type:complete